MAPLLLRPAGPPLGPDPALVRLLYLKHCYQLGYESLCREVAGSISWRRFCRIPLDQPVPHPTTLVKLVGRCGPGVVGQLNQALLGKLCHDKLLRARKLRIDTTVVEADIDHPTDADLLEHAVPELGWAWDLRLQPAAHDRGRQMTPTPAIDLAASTAAATPTRNFFRTK